MINFNEYKAFTILDEDEFYEKNNDEFNRNFKYFCVVCL